MPDNFDQLSTGAAPKISSGARIPTMCCRCGWPTWIFCRRSRCVRALRDVVDHGVFGYPRGLHGDTSDLPEYAQTIVERLRDRYAWHVEPQEVIFVPGVVVGFNVMCNMFRAQGGSIAVQPPVYPPILEAPQDSGSDAP